MLFQPNKGKFFMTIDQNAMNALFNDARTANGFIDKAVPTELLAQSLRLGKNGFNIHELPAYTLHLFDHRLLPKRECCLR
jgi:hypothetical protein